MSTPAIINESTVLSLLLEDGDGTKYPQAKIYDAVGMLVATRDLTHLALGRYAVNHTFTSTGEFFVLYLIYDDAAHTTESEGYYRTEERFSVVHGTQVYSVRQAWTRNAPNMLGTIWFEQGSQRINLTAGDALTITAKVASGLAFSYTSTTPNADGRFNVVVMYQPTPGTLIDIDAQVVTAQGTFKSQTSLSVPKLSA